MVTSNAVQAAPAQPKRRTAARRRPQARRQTPAPASQATQENTPQAQYSVLNGMIDTYVKSRHTSTIEALRNTSLLTFLDWAIQRIERSGGTAETPRTMTAGAGS
jgi:hypothetical protein